MAYFENGSESACNLEIKVGLCRHNLYYRCHFYDCCSVMLCQRDRKFWSVIYYVYLKFIIMLVLFLSIGFRNSKFGNVT